VTEDRERQDKRQEAPLKRDASAQPLSANRLCHYRVGQYRSPEGPDGGVDMNANRSCDGRIICILGWIQNLHLQTNGFEFFCVRLWTQKELLQALFTNYDQLDEDIKAELPLKRIWSLAAQEDEMTSS
jgi:hypothetical protein